MTRVGARYAISIAALLACAGAAAAQEQAAPEAAKPRSENARSDNECISFRTLSDWRVVGNTSLVIWAPTRRSPYHLRLTANCFGLRNAETLGFASRDERLCPFGGDAILVEQGGGLPERCYIQSITKLDEAELQTLLEQDPSRRGRRDREKPEDKE